MLTHNATILTSIGVFSSRVGPFLSDLAADSRQEVLRYPVI